MCIRNQKSRNSEGLKTDFFDTQNHLTNCVQRLRRQSNFHHLTYVKKCNFSEALDDRGLNQADRAKIHTLTKRP